jgi:hypothetical protein
LSDRERQNLEAHLQTCPLCAEEWRKIQVTEAGMATLRENVPLASDLQGMTKKILDGIQGGPPQRTQPLAEAVVETLNRLFSPALPRRAAVVVCFGMVCLFLGQHFLMLREVRGLERRLAGAPHAAASFNLNYIIPKESWEELERELGDGVAREALARFMQRKGNQVYLVKRPLRRLMVKYRARQTRRALVVAKFLEQHPKLKEKIEPLLKRKTPGVRPWFKLEQHRRKRP